MPIVAVARIHNSVSHEAVAEELAEHYSGWKSSSLDKKDHRQLSIEPFGRLEMNNASQSALLVTIGAVIFVLLVSYNMNISARTGYEFFEASKKIPTQV